MSSRPSVRERLHQPTSRGELRILANEREVGEDHRQRVLEVVHQQAGQRLFHALRRATRGDVLDEQAGMGLAVGGEGDHPHGDVARLEHRKGKGELGADVDGLAADVALEELAELLHVHAGRDLAEEPPPDDALARALRQALLFAVVDEDLALGVEDHDTDGQCVEERAEQGNLGVAHC
jgi:hypothetical protein